MSRNVTYIDLGTANLTVYTSMHGFVCRVPSLIAQKIIQQKSQLFAWGHQALSMLGKSPKNIAFRQPLREGVIADTDSAHQLIHQIFSEFSLSHFVKNSELIISLPQDCNNAEMQAVRDLGQSLKARKIYLMPEPLAAALGLGLPIFTPQSSMILDIGAGTTECSAIGLGGVIHSQSARIGGQDFSDAITRYVSDRRNFDIGPHTAEILKCELITAHPHQNIRSFSVKGYDKQKGWPGLLTLTSSELYQAYAPLLYKIRALVERTFDSLQPEIASDIATLGVQLVGGGSLIRGLPEWLSSEFGVKFLRTEIAQSAVATGGAFITHHSQLIDQLNLHQTDAQLSV